jgi:flagellar L-ring protein precursor FlgH
MKRTPLLILLLVAALSHAQSKSNPGSLFNSTARNPFTDNVARNVGDVLTVLVDEKTLANFNASTQATKSDSNSVNAQFFISLLDSLFKPVTTGANSSVSGSGTTSQSSKMTATMSVIVKQVMPNGNLVVEGRRSLITNKQTQTLVFSGIVRPADIKPNNTVKSTDVAEAEVKMDGTGLISQRQRKGILTQIIDWLF